MIGHMDIAGFDLNLMRAFDALYAARHVARAGSRIGLRQPSMSGALTRLRELLEDLAIERGLLKMHESGTFVKFTEKGAALFG
jgi:DNA-binding transcriptional LysR family regulator